MRKTKQHGKLILAVVLICFVAGFSPAQNPQPVASPGAVSTKPTTEAEARKLAANENATIYFYRIKQFAGSALEPSVYCDGKELARMDNGRYFGVTLQPGKHTCSMGDKQTGFEIDAKPGEEYYAKITLDMGFWKGHGRLNLMQKEQGAFELKKVKLLGVGKVKDRSLVTIFEGSEKRVPESGSNELR